MSTLLKEMMSQDKSKDIDSRRFGYIYLQHIENKFNYVVNHEVISANILNELNERIRVIFNLEPIITALVGVERNYLELLDSIENHRSLLNKLGAESLNVLPILVAMEGKLSATQKITNFLSSASAFLVQTETQIRRLHGKDSNELMVWNKTRKDLHASSFSYRFMYELRNFTQHDSLPFSTFKVLGTRASESVPMEFTTSITILRDWLLNKGYDWKKLKIEIERQPPEFDLLPFVTEYLNNLRQLCLASLKFCDSRLAECGSYLATITKKLKLPEGTVPVIFDGESNSEDMPPPRVELIPMTEFKYLFQEYDRLLKVCDSQSELKIKGSQLESK